MIARPLDHRLGLLIDRAIDGLLDHRRAAR